MPPGLHPVDPDAEAARLIAERMRSPDGFVFCDEIRQVWDGSKYRLVRIRVTADEQAQAPVMLAARLADLVRAEVWPS